MKKYSDWSLLKDLRKRKILNQDFLISIINKISWTELNLFNFHSAQSQTEMKIILHFAKQNYQSAQPYQGCLKKQK